MLSKYHGIFVSFLGQPKPAQTIVADAEKSLGAWTYKWITPVPGTPFAEHGAEKWYQFRGVTIGYDTPLNHKGPPLIAFN